MCLDHNLSVNHVFSKQLIRVGRESILLCMGAAEYNGSFYPLAVALFTRFEAVGD
jgi:hypothetical protein